MTNNPPNPPPENPEQGNILAGLGNFLRRPSTLIVGGILLTLGVTLYGGINYFVYQKLSPLLATELSKLLEREVKVGEVESFSLNRIRIGSSSIPKTKIDPDQGEIKAIALHFNLLPLLLGQPLKLDLTLESPNLSLKQDKTGQWLRLPETKEEGELDLPIDIDAKIRINQGNVALAPYSLTQSVTLKVDGEGGYLYKSQDEQEIRYDIAANILDSNVSIKGETALGSWKTQAQLKVNQLSLSKIVSLIPNLPLNLTSGQVDSNLNVSLPSLEKIEGTQGLGNFDISGIVAKIKPLKAPLKINLNLDFQGQTVQLQKTEISIDKLVTQITGGINWEKGYDLKVDIKPVSLKNVLNLIPSESPINLGGEIQGKLNLNGAIKNPILTGKINNTKPLIFDKVPIKNLNASFQGNLNQVVLKQVEIQPTAGGQITAKGQVETGILKSLEKKQTIDWQKMPLALGFQVKLPTEKLLTPYYRSPQPVSLGEIVAQGKIGGTLGKPLGKVQWRSPNLVEVSGESISGTGDILLAGQTISLKNAVLRSTGGNITLNGVGNLEKKQWQTLLTASKFSLDPFLKVACSIVTCPPQLLSQNIALSNANIRLGGKLDSLDLTKVQGMGNVTLTVDGGAIALSSNLSQGNLQATAFASGVSLDPYLPNLSVPVKVGRTQVNLSGSIAQLFQDSTLNLSRLKANGEAQLTVAGSPVNATARLNNGILQTTAIANQLPLNQLIPNLPVDSRLVRSQINLTGNLNSLLASLGKTPDFSSFQGNADLQLAVNNGQIKATGSLQNGMVRGIANLGSLGLNQIIPNLPIATQLVEGNVTVSSQLNPLLSNTPDLSSTQATVNLRLAAAEGTINTTTRLQSNQWNTDIAASNLNPTVILGKIAPNLPKINLSDLNAKLNLTGSLKSLFEPNRTISVQAKTISVQGEGQRLNAEGSLLLSNLTTTPDITNLNLSVNASSNLANLPLSQLISLVPVERGLLPEELKLRGQAEFKGRLLGKNLLTAPTTPGNLQLLGDVNLLDLAFNNRIFEPVLKGQLQATLGEKIALNLQGSEDIIAAALIPCTQAKCLVPYLPASFELRQTYGEQPPLIAQGTLKGDRLIAKVERFPLDVLKLAPGRDYGIPGFLMGAVTTEIDINLFTLEGKGRITLEKPSLGSIQAQEFVANVIYDNNVARLEGATLQLGMSRYDLQGSLNLKSGALQGNLRANRGRVEDLLATLQISNIDSVLHLLQLQPIDYAKAEGITPQSVGDRNASLAEQINLLALIDEKIRQLAAQRTAGSVPTELDVRGYFDTDIALGGTLSSPTINVALTGQNWQWHPQEAFPDIVEPLGLVIRDQEFIPINQVKIGVQIADGAIALKPVQIQIKDALIALQGNFSLQEIAASWRIEGFSVDTLDNLVKVPADVSGALNASGTLKGTLFNPQLMGEFALSDGAFRGRSIEQSIQGRFNYQDYRFQLVTTDNSVVYVNVSVPFPILPGNDAFAVDVRVNNQALELVKVFTQDQFTLIGGEGEVTAKAQGRIDLSQGLRLYDLNADGKITLNDTVFQSAAFPEPLTVTGQITLDDKTIQVEQIQGTFADSKLAIAGILPLFQPQPQLDNPLTVVIEKGKVNLQNLYNGGIDGRLVVKGSAIQPIVGGQVNLNNGQVFIPQTADQNQGQPLFTTNPWLNRGSRQGINQKESGLFIPQLENFQVSLQNLFVETLPLFRFQFDGNVVVNGSLNDLNALKPDGTIIIDRGIVNFLDTRFLVERRYQNQIVFTPQQGLLNPDIDIQMRTIVSDVSNNYSKQLRSVDTTEIPDDSLNKVQRVDVNLALDGSLNQLIPNLGEDGAKVCSIQNPLQPIRTTARVSEKELQQLANCLQILSAQGTSNEQLLSSSVVKLTSSPPRSQGEIVRLLGEQLFVLVDALQGQNTDQLIQFGIVQLALPMVFQGLVYDVETAVSDTIGSTDFRIVPFLETIYQVEDQGFVRLSYDYAFNEFRVRYEKRF